MNDAQLMGYATEFTFGDPSAGVKVSRRSWEPQDEAAWAIVRLSMNFNHDGEWEYEPLPSSRDDAFFKRCRWTLEEAVDQAMRLVMGAD